VKVYETTRKKSFGIAANKSRPSSTSSRVAPGFRRFIRKIVAQSTHSRKRSEINPRNDAEAGGVLMDVEIDGVRCLLFRSEKPSKTAVKLSPREREIVRMIAKGYPNKAIAGVLEISSWTVCTHLRRIFSKVGVTSRAAMIARVMELKLLEPCS
jgi:DNA-binding NarL/FixJ family response regulator